MPRNKKRKRSRCAVKVSSMAVSSQLELDKTVKHSVETLFSKQFHYSGFHDILFKEGKTSICTVEDLVGEEPSVCDTLWHDEDLMGLKQDLNNVKDQLSVHDIETWHAHTTKCNLAGAIIPHVKSLDVELCTQAWVKFCEIINAHKRIVPDQDFLSIHLCEAPGAFIASLNHYLVLKRFKHRWDWRATTLNPYHEANSMDAMIADDRLIRHTHSKWYFGPDGSGDLMVKGHVKGLCNLVEELKTTGTPLLLVTADGSKDCQSNPAEQEALLSKLHYCEALTACLLLDQGGSLVIKMFTMFESSSVILVFLLNVMFQEVHAIKPATSKGGNSEVYMVCLGYRQNIRPETLWKLLDLTVYSDSHALVNLPTMPPSFLATHRLCCHKFADWQKQTILRNVELFGKLDEEKTAVLHASQEHALEVFKERNQITSIRHSSKIGVVTRQMTNFRLLTCSSSRHQHGAPPTWSHKRLRGTFQLRQDLGHMTFSQRVKLMRAHRLPKPNLVLTSHFSLDEEMVSNPWSCLETAVLSGEVNNSRFCDVEILQDYNTILTDSKFQKLRAASLYSHCETVWRGLEDSVTTDFAGFEGGNGSLSAEKGNKEATEPNKKIMLYFYCDDLQRNSSAFQTFMDIAETSDVVKCVMVSDSFRLSLDSRDGASQHVFSDLTTLFHQVDGESMETPVSQYEEIRMRKIFLSRMLYLLKSLKPGSQLLLLTSTFLTRLTVGYLYILARCFKQISIKSEPNLWLHQLLVLDNFQNFGPRVQEKLEKVEALLNAEPCEPSEMGGCIMGIVDTPYLLSDRKFVQFVTAYNNFTVANFVDLMLEEYAQHSPSLETSLS